MAGGVRTAVRTPPANFFAPARSACVRTEQRLVLTRGEHCSDRLTIVAAVTVHVVAARIEAEAPRAGRAVGVERPRPVVAVANVVELVAPTETRSGQEETPTVRRCEESAVHAALGRPCVSGILV